MLSDGKLSVLKALLKSKELPSVANCKVHVTNCNDLLMSLITYKSHKERCHTEAICNYSTSMARDDVMQLQESPTSPSPKVINLLEKIPDTATEKVLVFISSSIVSKLHLLLLNYITIGR